MIRARLAVLAVAGLIAVLGVTAITASGAGHETEVRITAALAADGRIEFALQQREADDGWSERLLPRARFFPATATVGRWLSSTPLTVRAPDAGDDADDAEGAEVRITAQRLADGRTEFALQQREADDEWSERLLPRARFFPATATVGRWLSSTPVPVVRELIRSGRDCITESAGTVWCVTVPIPFHLWNMGSEEYCEPNIVYEEIYIYVRGSQKQSKYYDYRCYHSGPFVWKSYGWELEGHFGLDIRFGVNENYRIHGYILYLNGGGPLWSGEQECSRYYRFERGFSSCTFQYRAERTYNGLLTNAENTVQINVWGSCKGECKQPTFDKTYEYKFYLIDENGR